MKKSTKGTTRKQTNKTKTLGPKKKTNNTQLNTQTASNEQTPHLQITLQQTTLQIHKRNKKLKIQSKI